MNLALRDVRYHQGRFVLTSLGLGLLIGVVMSMGGIYRGLVADALSFSHAAKADLWVVQQDTNGPFAATSRIPEDIRYRIAAVPGILEASPLSFQTIQIERQGKPFRFFLVGYDLNGFGGPPEILSGRPIRRKHYEMVAGQGMKMNLGENIRLGLNDYTVVGITGKLVSSGGDPAAYVSLPDAQDIQFKNDNDAIRNDRSRIAARLGEISALSAAQAERLRGSVAGLTQSTHIVNTVVARLAPDADPAEIQARIGRWSHFRAISNEEQSRIITKGMIEKARMQLGLFRVILLVISAVIISLIIYTSTLDKIRVIATLKLIGSPNTLIVGLILQQSLMMGIIAYVVGYLLISLTYEKFPRRVVLEPFDLQVLFVIVMAICALASFAGIRKALKVEPAEALGG
ncbi:MAG: ABC transporter permease [Elusimicrobia bacterium]|nr:ABC transporter permease [Elusimicrobiota bacterium]